MAVMQLLNKEAYMFVSINFILSHCILEQQAVNVITMLNYKFNALSEIQI